jgi:hypothetical protein
MGITGACPGPDTDRPGRPTERAPRSTIGMGRVRRRALSQACVINFADLVAGAGRALVIMVSGDHQWLDGLLPHLAGVVVQQIERTGSDVLVWAHARAEDGICPSCGGRFRRVHNRYHRGLADSPVAGQPVVLRLQVRRFFCDNHDCPVRTFAEQFGGLTVKHARRTSLCRRALEHIGLALAGRAGSRLAGRLGFVVGRSTLLRPVHAPGCCRGSTTRTPPGSPSPRSPRSRPSASSDSPPPRSPRACTLGAISSARPLSLSRSRCRD